MPLKKSGKLVVQRNIFAQHVMVSKRIKILPFIIRDKRAGDTKMKLRTHLANFLRVNISPLWNNDEFHEFIDLIEDPNAR